MWIYTPSVSVPEPADLILDCAPLAQAYARSVTWSGKHSPPQRWSERLERDSWTRRLSGMTPKPLTAIPGMEQWISSLAASRASRTASGTTTADAAPTTPVICGRTSDASSENASPTLYSWRMLQGLADITGISSGQSYKEWLSALRKDCLRRVRLAPPIRGSACSSWESGLARNSLELYWRTPTILSIVGAPGIKADGSMGKYPKIKWQAWRLTQDIWDSSPQLMPTMSDGHACSRDCRRTNPRFAEWIMGWPLGWTNLAASDSLWQQTEWCRWSQHMRSSLSQLGWRLD